MEFILGRRCKCNLILDTIHHSIILLDELGPS